MFIKRIAVAGFLAISLSNWALADNTSATTQKKDDAYYADDLNAALSEARQRTHHYDYSNAMRYNRSTSQSISLTRIRNQDLESLMVESASLGSDTPMPEDDNEVATSNSNDIDDLTPSSNEAVSSVPANRPSMPMIGITPGVSISVRQR